MQTVSVGYAGQISVASGKNPRELYAHQQEAVKKLDQENQSSFEGLLVLPTGGGKTLTAVHWLLRNFIDKRKKVLWVAHRHELLDQAFETVRLSAYSSLLRNVQGFRYRVISGHPKHDRPVNIESTDDIIIASKDSLNSGLYYLLNNWANHTDSILLVVDEAHHATAKTYRNLITAIKENFENRKKSDGFRMLGLTATPFRTDKDEQGLLKQVFPDDIIFSEDLKTLVARGILADPIFENLKTNIDFYQELTPSDIKAIQAFDKLPQKVAERIAMSSRRNRCIVDHYCKNRKKYKPLLVFAVDVQHAIELNGIFKSRGINSDFIVSRIVDMRTNATISPKENSEKIKRFRDGELEVLINVEMLTEGTDLPNVQTVFLTRPTTSTILMTQMIGRALRGQKAGGTEQAFVVSFIDNWEDKINWVSPDKLDKKAEDFPLTETPTKKQPRELIPIELIEMFARMMDEKTPAENYTFLDRIPVGIYHFSLFEPLAADDLTVQSSNAPLYDVLEEAMTGETIARSYTVLLFNDSYAAYDDFVNDLPILFKPLNIETREILTQTELDDLLAQAKELYFPNHQSLIGYRDDDVKNILRFYAHKKIKPEFLSFAEREKCQLFSVVKTILQSKFDRFQEFEYLNSLWNAEKSFWKVLFHNNRDYFLRQVQIEVEKEIKERFEKGKPTPTPTEPIATPDSVPPEKLSLQEIKEHDPIAFLQIRNEVFAKQTDENGFIHCAGKQYTGRNFKSQMRRDFQIDHIKPMAEGGLTTIENLQVLSRKAHAEKTRQENLKRRQTASVK